MRQEIRLVTTILIELNYTSCYSKHKIAWVLTLNDFYSLIMIFMRCVTEIGIPYETSKVTEQNLILSRDKFKI
jgi:hypothetical protein